MVTRVRPVPVKIKIKTSRTKGRTARPAAVRAIKVPTAMVAVSNSSRNSNSLKLAPAIATVPIKKSSNSRFNLANFLLKKPLSS